jgi:hypothetical protein
VDDGPPPFFFTHTSHICGTAAAPGVQSSSQSINRLRMYSIDLNAAGWLAG